MEYNPILSVIIPDDPATPDFVALLNQLKPQLTPAVQLVTFAEPNKLYTWQRKQILLNRCAGLYSCVVRSKDGISGRYISQLLAGMETLPDAVGFSAYRSRGGNFTDIHMGLHSPAMVGPTEFRYISDCCPVRTDIMQRIGFVESDNSARTYAHRLMQSELLKRVVLVGERGIYIERG